MHVLQPKHTKLDAGEAKRVLLKYNIALAQLPKISRRDPVLPNDCKKGDVVKIERKGELAEVYYRVVI